MEWARWEPLYRDILRDFRYDPERDARARDRLDQLARDALPADLDALAARLRGREAWIGGGAATHDDAARIPPDAPLLLADAACGALAPHRRPDAVVTDLDGDVGLQLALNRLGVPVFLHAHGDNERAIERHARAFHGPLQPTTQAEPKGRAANFGGFTDGDRAACLAVHLGATRLALVGFDFEAPAAKPGADPATKRRKLAWARRILDATGAPWRIA